MRTLHLFLLGTLLLSAGCSSSRITSSWHKQQTTARQYKTILVLGLINSKDRQVQERMELHLAGDLVNLGYTAISSLQEYGPKAFEGMTEKETVAAMRNRGIDAVITIVLLDKRRERKYVPGKTYNPGEFWNYIGSRNHMIYEPGYYVTDTKYFWETNFYDMSDQSLLYSVQSRSFSPDSKEQMGHEYGKLIVADMVKQKVLARIKPEPEE